MTCSQHNFGVVTSVDMLKSADFLSGKRWAVRGFCDKVCVFAEQKKEKAHHEDGPCGIGRVSSRWIEFTSQTDHSRECRFRYEEKVGFC
jgi:hypothetical protein